MRTHEVNHQNIKATNFYRFHHEDNILVLPNAWDAVSACLFEQAGFLALGTTSAGVAASLGYAEPEKISRDEMLKAVKRIVNAVNIPVSADLEAGYANNTNDVFDTVKLAIETGVVGINLEDTTHNNGYIAFTLEEQVERLRAARRATRSISFPFVINARVDAYLFNIGDQEQRFSEVVKRSNAYLESGADCIFIPGVSDETVIANLVKEIKGPINILANPHVPSASRLKQLGVKRVSTGSGPMRATLAVLRNIAENLNKTGDYQSFTNQNIPYSEVNQFF